MTIMQWCMENNILISLALSILTLFISVIAVVVAIATARLPYKKKVKITLAIAYNGTAWTVGVNAVNVGNRTVKVEMMGLLINDKQIFDQTQIGKNQILLSLAGITTHYIECSGLLFTCKNLPPRFPVYGYVQDSEGKVYKERFGTVAALINNCKQVI